MSQIKPGSPYDIGRHAGIMSVETHQAAVPPEYKDPRDLMMWNDGYCEGRDQALNEGKKNA